MSSLRQKSVWNREHNRCFFFYLNSNVPQYANLQFSAHLQCHLRWLSCGGAAAFILALRWDGIWDASTSGCVCLIRKRCVLSAAELVPSVTDQSDNNTQKSGESPGGRPTPELEETADNSLSCITCRWLRQTPVRFFCGKILKQCQEFLLRLISKLHTACTCLLPQLVCTALYDRGRTSNVVWCSFFLSRRLTCCWFWDSFQILLLLCRDVFIPNTTPIVWLMMGRRLHDSFLLFNT